MNSTWDNYLLYSIAGIRSNLPLHTTQLCTYLLHANERNCLEYLLWIVTVNGDLWYATVTIFLSSVLAFFIFKHPCINFFRKHVNHRHNRIWETKKQRNYFPISDWWECNFQSTCMWEMGRLPTLTLKEHCIFGSNLSSWFSQEIIFCLQINEVFSRPERVVPIAERLGDGCQCCSRQCMHLHAFNISWSY